MCPVKNWGNRDARTGDIYICVCVLVVVVLMFSCFLFISLLVLMFLLCIAKKGTMRDPIFHAEIAPKSNGAHHVSLLTWLFIKVGFTPPFSDAIKYQMMTVA